MCAAPLPRLRGFPAQGEHLQHGVAPSLSRRPRGGRPGGRHGRLSRMAGDGAGGVDEDLVREDDVEGGVRERVAGENVGGLEGEVCWAGWGSWRPEVWLAR
jgi:hypothetical protein